MNRQQAVELLGLHNARCGLTADIVTEAFRREAKRVHPDSPSRTMQGPAMDMDLLTIARDFLLKNLGSNDDFACKLCGGLGMVRAKIGWLRCAACKGTGARR